MVVKLRRSLSEQVEGSPLVHARSHVEEAPLGGAHSLGGACSLKAVVVHLGKAVHQRRKQDAQ